MNFFLQDLNPLKLISLFFFFILKGSLSIYNPCLADMLVHFNELLLTEDGIVV